MLTLIFMKIQSNVLGCRNFIYSKSKLDIYTSYIWRKIVIRWTSKLNINQRINIVSLSFKQNLHHFKLRKIMFGSPFEKLLYFSLPRICLETFYSSPNNALGPYSALLYSDIKALKPKLSSNLFNLSPHKRFPGSTLWL
jgi:hypothetical protein